MRGQDYHLFCIPIEITCDDYVDIWMSLSCILYEKEEFSIRVYPVVLVGVVAYDYEAVMLEMCEATDCLRSPEVFKQGI